MTNCGAALCGPAVLPERFLLQKILALDRKLAAATSSQHDFRNLLDDYVAELQRTTPLQNDELAAVGAMHLLPWVRFAALQRLVDVAPESESTRDLICWLTHDYDDFVAFEAIRKAGDLRLYRALPELMMIVGPASRRLTVDSGKPVGFGHALVLDAITRIVGLSEDILDELRRIESDAFPEGILSGSEQIYLGREFPERASPSFHDHRGMSRILPGDVLMGIPPSWQGRDNLLDWNGDPADVVPCAEFWMDRHVVTNAQYDAFAASDNASEHRYCHPSEPINKVHWRNTLLDERLGPSHPAAGVDWFDAYAYAKSVGKRLPTEAEWQRAAQGDQSDPYPWGLEFNHRLANSMPCPPFAGWQAIQEWRTRLLALFDAPTGSIPWVISDLGDSPFGIFGTSGNVWEWTLSGYFGGLAAPKDGNRDALDVISDDTSYAVIKGGAWTCLPEQASVAFRGRDLLFDRHMEIGFRCVCDCT